MQQTIGDVRITLVRESVTPTPPEMLFGEFDHATVDAHAAWLKPTYVDADDHLLISIHALVVESQGKVIVVDTCVGDRELPGYDLLADRQNTFLEDLRAAGFDPGSVDLVLCTHLHFDHVGWNTMLVDGSWVATFPNARYLIGRREYEHWRTGDTGPESLALTFVDAVVPVVEAGLVDLVEMDHGLTEEVRLVPTPGHTPGHASVVIESGGARAVITGDVVHHPIQFAATDWANFADVDADVARATRDAFCADHADRDVLVFGTHFAGTSCGHLRSGDGTYRFDPVT